MKHEQLYLKEAKSTLDFLAHALGFKTQQHIEQNGVVIIYTNDCLNDYFNLKSSGVQFKGNPKYVTNGLAARFVDSWGNDYELLEKRDYEAEE